MRYVTSLLAATALALSACTTTPATQTAETTPTAPAPTAAQDGPTALQAPLPQITPMPSAYLDERKTVTRITLGSCLKQNDDQSIWDTIAAADSDVFLFLGDNVYGDVWEDNYDLPELRQAYADLAKSLPFARFRSETPVLVTWDDHDYGRNDFGANFPMKKEAEALFEDVWALDDDDIRRRRPGVYRAYMLGEEEGRQVQIILLDTRYFRSDLLATDEKNAPGKERYMPDPDPAKTMLGEDQWLWLKEELNKPADLRIVASSIQVIADGHGWEAWRTLPAERQRLYDLIASTAAENVIFVSGDRHAGAVYKRDHATNYPLYELTASSLNAPASIWRAKNNETRMEAGPYRLTPMFYEANFGQIDIDWQAEEVSLKLVGADGSVGQEQVISLSDLRPVY